MMSLYFAAVLFGVIGRLQGSVKDGEADVYGYPELFKLNVERKKDLCMDIVFVVDRSCSIPKDDLANEYRIIEKTINGIEGYGPDKTRIGLVTFDFKARVVFGLDDEETSTREGLLAKLDELKKDTTRPETCKTYTWDALRMARNDSKLFGGVDKNSNRTKILILITDGIPYDNKDNVVEMANETLKEGKFNDDDDIKTMVFVVKNKKGNLPPEGFFFKLVYKLRWLFRVEGEFVESFEVFFFPLLARFTCPYKCDEPIDLIYVMDRSISITEPNIKKIKDFYKAITESFAIGDITSYKTKSSVAMLSYNSDVYEHFTGLDCSDTPCILKKIDEIPDTHEEFTVTNLALREVKTIVNQNTRNGKFGIRSVVVLTTDGNTWPVGAPYIASPSLSISEADKLRGWGIDTVVIAAPNHLENPGEEELRGIASDFLFTLQSSLTSFEDLIPIAPKVVKLICDKYKPNVENEA